MNLWLPWPYPDDFTSHEKADLRCQRRDKPIKRYNRLPADIGHIERHTATRYEHPVSFRSTLPMNPRYSSRLIFLIVGFAHVVRR